MQCYYLLAFLFINPRSISFSPILFSLTFSSSGGIFSGILFRLLVWVTSLVIVKFQVSWVAGRCYFFFFLFFLTRFVSVVSRFQKLIRGNALGSVRESAGNRGGNGRINACIVRFDRPRNNRYHEGTRNNALFAINSTERCL